KRAIRQTRAIRELPLQIRRRNMLLSKMVGYIKTRSAKQITVLRNCLGKSVWQRNYSAPPDQKRILSLISR
ncbi:MAG: hypothetical protein KJ893_00400, partial [Candidatus Omnitrophica bacterium]|nr:hypothetical protein [Candidatus Omnitrophota bacterium]